MNTRQLIKNKSKDDIEYMNSPNEESKRKTEKERGRYHTTKKDLI